MEAARIAIISAGMEAQKIRDSAKEDAANIRRHARESAVRMIGHNYALPNVM
jgi:hypothetical protein